MHLSAKKERPRKGRSFVTLVGRIGIDKDPPGPEAAGYVYLVWCYVYGGPVYLCFPFGIFIEKDF